jgi:ABC-type phosphate transport system auxiliary subunit
MNNDYIIPLTIITAVIILAAVMLVLVLNRILLSINRVRLQVAQSVVPKFIDLSPTTNSMVELGVEVWRLQKRLEKLNGSITDDQYKALQNSYTKLLRYLERNDIGINDYTKQKYNEGMNLDVLAVEKDKNIKQSMIKETHEPAITHKGQLIRKAKVILLEP